MLGSLITTFSLIFITIAGADYQPPFLVRNVTSTKFSKSWDLRTCLLPANSVTGKWKIGVVIPKTFVGCTNHDDQFPWIRLNAYRSGGWKYRHWKHVDSYSDTSRCLKNWLYYASDGKTLIGKVNGYSTKLGDKDTLPWCATWVYQSGDERGYEWDYCINCTMMITHPRPGSAPEATTPEPTLKTKITQERF